MLEAHQGGKVGKLLWGGKSASAPFNVVRKGHKYGVLTCNLAAQNELCVKGLCEHHRACVVIIGHV